MKKEFDKAIITNPRIFKENRIDAHSGHRFYVPSNASALDDYDRPEVDHELKMSLNGMWKVMVVKNPSLIPYDFYKEDFDISGFSPIKVPAHIQTEGFDRNSYVNYQYPWDGVEDIKPGEMPSEYNPVACYVNYFDLAEIDKSRRYHICFDGAESNLVLWVNGQYVGYAEDAFTTSEFDLTDFLRPGRNKLACLVYKWCSSCFVDDQDFFRFSGIFRDVTLRSHASCHINDIRVVTELDAKYKDAVLKLDVKLTGNISKDYTIIYGLYEKYTAESFPEDLSEAIVGGEVKAEAIVTISEKVKNPDKWSAEKPNLYDLYIAVCEKHYDTETKEVSYINIIEYSKLKVGFRKFEMKDGIMCINGKRIVFNGVNRHEFSMRTGRAISYEETEQDIINMKKNNINALRTSHYPNAEYVYDLCDEYGLYVICENNMESHGSWANIYAGMTTKEEVVPGDNPDFKELIIDRAVSMIEKEKNHPSILIWSCGNESFGGSNIWEMSQRMRELDGTRLIHYESIFHDRRYPDTSDMESQMYPSVEAIVKHLAENKDKPFICCEYTHAMGNSCGAMFKYTDLTKTEPRYQGGFIWDYIDQALETENIFGEKYLGYGGDFGDRPCDYEFSGDGICYADRTDSPKMPSVKYNYQPVSFEVKENYGKASDGLYGTRVSIELENMNLFTDFSEYDFDLLFEINGEITEIDYTYDKKLLKLKPGEKADISFELEYDSDYSRETDIFTATVFVRYKNDNLYANAGDILASYQYRREIENPYYREAEYSSSEIEAFKVIPGGYNVGVRGDRFSLLFSGLNGGLTSYVYDGKEYIDVIPRPNFFRAPTDNDRGNQMPFRYAQWKSASLYQSFKDPADPAKFPIEISKGENQVTLSYTYYLPTVPASSVKVSYTVYPDGKVTVNMKYNYSEGLIEMPEFGMLMKLPHDLENMRWLGLGPQETYADRTEGALFAWHQNKVSDNFAKYLRPQECGNKMDVYEAYLTDDFGRGIHFSGREMNFSALPYSPEEIECALHPYELKRSDHTVVRVSLAQMGVGGDDTWGALTHPEFLLPRRDLEFEFSFVGV